MTAKKYLDFFIKIGQLKKIKRTGWVLRGVKDPESIGDHTFRMSLMAWFFAKDKKLDITRVMKMSLIHDICEVYAGDMTPYDEEVSLGLHKKDKTLFNRWPRRMKTKKEELSTNKHEKELSALKKLTGGLPVGLQQEVLGLWSEYEDGLTAEGRFLRQLDRVENVLQASEYRAEQGSHLMMDSFWQQVKELVDDPDLLNFIQATDKNFSKK